MAKQFIETKQTPGGKSVLVFHPSEEMTQADADGLMAEMCPGGKLFGKPMIFFHANVPDADAKAALRRAGPKMAENPAPIAVVCSTMLMRIAVKALIVLQPHSGPIKVTQNLEEALRWMDEVVTG